MSLQWNIPCTLKGRPGRVVYPGVSASHVYRGQYGSRARATYNTRTPLGFRWDVKAIDRPACSRGPFFHSQQSRRFRLLYNNSLGWASHPGQHKVASAW